MQNFETRNDIKQRILKDAAREWGYRGINDIDLNAFDPLVDLILGACSFELEKLSNDITNSRNRIFECLVEILTPDIMTKAQPAYSIMHATSAEPTYVTQHSDQFLYKIPELKKEIFFSPADRYKIFNGDVSFIIRDHQILKINDRLEKDIFIEANYGSYISPGTFYLGIKLDNSIKSLEDLCFFFDWKNEPRVNSFLKYLSFSKWTVNGKELSIQAGNNQKPSFLNKDDWEQEPDIFSALGVDKYIETNISQTCAHHFITIKDQEINIQEELRLFPEELKEFFNESDLAKFEQAQLWLKVSMPQSLRDHLKTMDCLMNCIPVINRKLNIKEDKLQHQLHILPIDCKDTHLLAIDQMTNSKGSSYKEVPLKIVDEADHGMFAIRERGVRRFDSREADHLLAYTMDMIKDETAAFRGMSYETFGADLEEMDTIFRRIKKNFNRSKSEIENTSFLFIRPFSNDNLVFIKYWTTDGAIANRIPHGTPLQLFSNTDLVASTLMMVATSKGGRDKLQAVDSIHAFKEVVMTRGRVVTPEDIKSFCINAIGFRNIQKIEIKKGVEISQNAKEGLIRTINVHLFKKINALLTNEEWDLKCTETENRLAAHSSAIHPIKLTAQ